MDKNKAISKLTEYSSWNYGKAEADQITLFDFSTFIASPDLIFAMQALLSPDIIRHAECCFLEEKFDLEVFCLWQEKKLSKNQIEKVMNHIHMTRIIQDGCYDYEILKCCAEIICEFWNMKFKNEGLIAEYFGDDLDNLAITLSTKQVK